LIIERKTNFKPSLSLPVISKGQIETPRYRFLARTGGYAWVVTQATIVYEKQKPQSVVCINYIIR
jgi:hypoxia-inducible factor 1 alpha